MWPSTGWVPQTETICSSLTHYCSGLSHQFSCSSPTWTKCVLSSWYWYSQSTILKNSVIILDLVRSVIVLMHMYCVAYLQCPLGSVVRVICIDSKLTVWGTICSVRFTGEALRHWPYFRTRWKSSPQPVQVCLCCAFAVQGCPQGLTH